MIALFIIIGFWIFVLFLDNIFKSCMLPPYMNLLNNGLSIKIGIIQLYTSRWNRCLQKWGCWRPKLQQKWFNMGVITTGLLMPVATFFLLSSLRNLIISLSMSDTGSSVQSELQIIQPVLPGINIPLSDLPYYIVTLLLCSVLHEIGHALSATKEDVKVQGFGFFFMGIFPGAFVDLPSDQMSFLTPWQQLRIFCAGVWHNVVIVIAGLCLLGVTPLIGEPFYERGNGITVLNIDSNSGVSGPNGLQRGDVITGVNFCTVKSTINWKTCLEDMAKSPRNGFCVSRDLIKMETIENQQKSGKNIEEFQCCPPDSQTDLCFAFQLTTTMNYSCLSARNVVDHSSQGCKSSKECKLSEVCLWATLKENSTLLVPIQRRGRKTVLFLGPLHELFSAVSLSDYVSRHWLISTTPIHIWETFLKYMVAFSGALAILNVIPCFYLDGKFILKGFVELTFGAFDANTRNAIALVLTWAGTLLLFTLVLCGVLTLIKT